MKQGQLTYHFKKRSDLIIAVTESSLDRVAEFLFKKNPGLSGKGLEQLLAITGEFLKSKTRARALIGLIVEADDNPEVREKILAQGEKARALIGLGLGLPADAPEVTAAHATLIGYGMMFFLQDDKEKRALLEQHYRHTISILTDHLKKTKKKGKK
jgi:AcrR family transcriptional regulator